MDFRDYALQNMLLVAVRYAVVSVRQPAMTVSSTKVQLPPINAAPALVVSVPFDGVVVVPVVVVPVVVVPVVVVPVPVVVVPVVVVPVPVVVVPVVVVPVVVVPVVVVPVVVVVTVVVSVDPPLTTATNANTTRKPTENLILYANR